MARKKIIHVRCTDATITVQTPYTTMPGVTRGWPNPITGHDAKTRQVRTEADAEIPKRVIKNLEQLEDLIDDDVIGEVVELLRQYRNGVRLAHVSRALQELDRLKTAIETPGSGSGA